MYNSSYTGSFLLVEGEDDLKLFEQFTEPNDCHVVESNGKDNVKIAMNILNMQNHKGVLAIIDADFTYYNGISSTTANLILTDYHDMEILIFMSKAFDNIIKEYASSNKLDKFRTNNSGQNLRNILLEKSMPIALMRWWSEEENKGLNFSELKFERFIDLRTLDTDSHKFIHSIINNTNKFDLDFNELQAQFKTLKRKSTIGLEQLCNGHDLCEIFAIGLRKAFGSHSEKIGNGKNVKKLFRLSFEMYHLKFTQLYKDVDTWTQSNNPYKIFYN